MQVDGVLMPPNGPDCWPKKDSVRQWIVFYRLDDLTFTGIGTIEGNGEKWWDLPCKPHKVFSHQHLYFFYSPFELVFTK